MPDDDEHRALFGLSDGLAGVVQSGIASASWFAAGALGFALVFAAWWERWAIVTVIGLIAIVYLGVEAMSG